MNCGEEGEVTQRGEREARGQTEAEQAPQRAKARVTKNPAIGQADQIAKGSGEREVARIEAAEPSRCAGERESDRVRRGRRSPQKSTQRQTWPKGGQGGGGRKTPAQRSAMPNLGSGKINSCARDQETWTPMTAAGNVVTAKWSNNRKSCKRPQAVAEVLLETL